MKNQMDLKQVKKAQLILRALNHKLRQEILKIIYEKPNIIVTDLYVKLKIEQSVVSQQLAILRNAKIVKFKRQGKYIKYSVNDDMINHILDTCQKLVS
jgi:DNA-binding transcriptional ArsR family regulator